MAEQKPTNENLPKITQMINKIGFKFPILLGDLYHTKAYFLTSKLGNNELCRILAVI